MFLGNGVILLGLCFSQIIDNHAKEEPFWKQLKGLN